MNQPRAVNEKEASQMIGVAVQTLRNWRHQRKGPVYIKMGRLVRYEIDDLADFIRSRKIHMERY